VASSPVSHGPFEVLKGLGFRVKDSRVQGLWVRVWGFTVLYSRIRVEGLGFRV
jgi:hypothetical protein